jgi:hypothetical protein
MNRVRLRGIWMDRQQFSASFGRALLVLLALSSALAALADEEASRNPAALELAQTDEAVTLKSESGSIQLRYQLKGGADKNLSVSSGCYFHPFSTPSGVVVTEVAPEDHRHHRGIFLAFVEMHGEKDADFWGWGEHAPKDGRVIINRSVTAGQDKNPVITAHNEWTADGKIVVNETLVAALTRPSPRANVLDLYYTLTPSADTTLSQWAFSGFCVRTRKDARLTAIGPKGEVELPNPSHLEPRSDWPAEPWYAYVLQMNDNTTAAVAVIDHPKNPPAFWHNHRDIRMLNPSIVAPAAVKLSTGQPLVLRYRVVAYDGRPSSHELDYLAGEFAKVK